MENRQRIKPDLTSYIEVGCGFGGSCFPKDIKALISVASKLGVDPALLKSVWDTNLKVRPEKDWEKLKGRSVVEEE